MSLAIRGSPREGGRRRLIRVVNRAEKVTCRTGKILKDEILEIKRTI